MKICKIDNCEKKHYSKGWCKMHYTRNLNHGSPHILLQDKVGKKFLAKKEAEDRMTSLWNWWLYRPRQQDISYEKSTSNKIQSNSVNRTNSEGVLLGPDAVPEVFGSLAIYDRQGFLDHLSNKLNSDRAIFG